MLFSSRVLNPMFRKEDIELRKNSYIFQNSKNLWSRLMTWHLQFAGSSEVSQKLDNVSGHRWGSRQMSTGGLESVLISYPVDSVSVAIISGIREATTGNDADVLHWGTNFLQVSALADGNSIVSLETSDSFRADFIVSNYWWAMLI